MIVLTAELFCLQILVGDESCQRQLTVQAPSFSNGMDHKSTQKANLGKESHVQKTKVSLSNWEGWGGKTRTTPAFFNVLSRLKLKLSSPLDFEVGSDDTSLNLLAAPLLSPVMCPYSDVHHWRVFLLPKLKLLPTYSSRGNAR